MLTTISGGFSFGHGRASKRAARLSHAFRVAPPDERIGVVVVQLGENRARGRAVAEHADAFERDRFVEQRLDRGARADAVGVRADDLRPKKIVLTASRGAPRR